MNRAGVLLDAGPLVALLDPRDVNHEKAKRVIAACAPPLRTCEAVVAEASHLISKNDPAGRLGVLKLGRRGTYEIALRLDEHWIEIEGTLTKYRDQPASLADVCLIRCAEVYDEPRIVTFDSDFRVYRWGRNRPFEILE